VKIFFAFFIYLFIYLFFFLNFVVGALDPLETKLYCPERSNVRYEPSVHLFAGYMAYETVAQIVDLALLVRQDNLACPGSPFSRYMPATGYSTRHSVDCRQVRTE